MMRISAVHDPALPELSDTFLRTMSQLGVDCIDFADGGWLPGVKEQGYPDLDELLAIKRRLSSWGLEVNRVSLPDITAEFILDRDGAERELENAIAALRVFGEAKMPIARQRFHGDTFNHLLESYQSVHRGGYIGHGDRIRRLREEQASDPDLQARRTQVWDTGSQGPPAPEALEDYWRHFCLVYDRLVPLAEELDVKLAMHPSDSPLPDTPFGTLGYHRVIDAFPSRQVGYLYCCGTRAEAGGLPLVLDEIHNYGRQGRIFMVHLRAIRASLATAQAYEETALDDGDMNVFEIIRALDRVGFDGCINPDHMALLDADFAAGTDITDAPGRLRKFLDDFRPGPQIAQHGIAYAVGYIKAMLAALDALDGRSHG